MYILGEPLFYHRQPCMMGGSCGMFYSIKYKRSYCVTLPGKFLNRKTDIRFPGPLLDPVPPCCLKHDEHMINLQQVDKGCKIESWKESLCSPYATYIWTSFIWKKNNSIYLHYCFIRFTLIALGQKQIPNQYASSE